MKPENAGKMKYGIWGVVLGGVITMIIGFSWGGWTTASTAKAMNHEAVLASQSAICVAQFMNDPEHEAKLQELREMDSWKRAEFIQKGGWAIMPGHENSTFDVAKACADGLEALIEK